MCVWLIVHWQSGTCGVDGTSVQCPVVAGDSRSDYARARVQRVPATEMRGKFKSVEMSLASKVSFLSEILLNQSDGSMLVAVQCRTRKSFS